MKTNPLFRRDFTLMVIGQIASLFGNSILRFALSLYVLDLTGSAAAFGTILAVSMIPTILFSPIGGILADRASRKYIMVILDFTTSALIIAFSLLIHATGSLLYIGIIMMLLATIQSFYQPAVQSSIPSLVEDGQLMKANGVVTQVNALSNLLGPILGGFLYAFLGLFPILAASAVCFFFSAVMEVFLHIPFIRSAAGKNLLSTVQGDLKDALRFLTHEQPVMVKLLFILTGLNLFLSSMIMIGLPYIVKIFLGLGGQYYGFAEGALAAGTVLGGCAVGVFANRTPFNRSYRFLLAGSLMLIPLGLAAISSRFPLVSYTVVLLSVLCCMFFASLFNIFAQTFAQQQTPKHLLGKVMSFVTVICMCAFPIGQALYGFLFDYFHDHIFLVVFFGVIASIFVTLGARKTFHKLPGE